MRILHVVTLVGPGNPFGGPTTVALNQARELRRRGHEVTLLAARWPRSREPSEFTDEFVTYGAFWPLPSMGYSGLVSPRLILDTWRLVRDYDVVHCHVSRDLVTLPVAAIARLRRRRVVLQPHGMVDRSSRLSARLIDALLLRRVISSAVCTFWLTLRERDEIKTVMGGREYRSEHLPNGIRAPLEAIRSGVRTTSPEFLFCSRLHIRKRPQAFLMAALDVIKSDNSVQFSIVGPDEGELSNLRATLARAGNPERVSIEPAIEPHKVSARISRSSVLVLPSIDEPFGMIVLEALAVGVPVIVTESCGLASAIRRHDCGLVVPPDDHRALVAAMNTFLSQPRLADEMGVRGRAAVAAQFGIEPVVDRLEIVYRT